MKVRKSKFVLTTVLASCLLCKPALAEQSLETLFRESWGGTFEPLSAASAEQIQTLFEETFKDPISNSLATDWAKVGFDAVWTQSRGEELLVVHERTSSKSGRGFYVFRINKKVPLIFVAPHVPSDEDTGHIALQLFIESRAAAAGWNTIRRDSKENELSDMARLTSSALLAFNLAFAHSNPVGRALQLHGFASRKRRSLEGISSDWIVGNGSAQPTVELSSFAKALADQRLGTVRLYPRDVRELGGLTDSIGDSLRKQSFNGFVHLEINRPIRAQLLHDEDARRRFLSCLDPGEQ